ncbi:MAG TPA: PilZ domain-containing protein [Candidatus Acidoferrales bacterium]|nr:PilZ domain-containing protein [Candidatus Acidoferrales bacterium]
MDNPASSLPQDVALLLGQVARCGVLCYTSRMSNREEDRRLEPRAVGETMAIEFTSPTPHVRDFSSSGLYVADPRPLQLGQPVEMRLAFGPGDVVVVRGMVRRVEAGQGMAIEFTHIDAAARRRIKDFISRTDAKKISAAGPQDI